ncbi:MAG: CRTAC1 family protein [bacterium]|nr:CRTAC1 family protein [bacterium]
MLLPALLSFAPLATPQSPAPFTQEAGPRGIDYFTFGSGGAGRGVGLVDLDGDGDPDLVALGRVDEIVGVWENDGNGVFIERTQTTGIGPIPGVVGLAAADVDGDGDADLYLSGWNLPNALLRNDGNFQFTNVAPAVGVDDDGRGSGSAMADFDLDGDIDIYASNNTQYSPPEPLNLLYQNLGGMSFNDVAPAQGVASDDFTWQSVFFDSDRDGDADLYVSNDKGWSSCNEHNFLFVNQGGQYVDVSAGSGADICIDSMGVAVGDFDGNRYQDLYCTNTPGGNVLLLNQGGNTFLDASATAGVESFRTGWGAIFFDWDNDGVQDLYVCNQDGPSRLYANKGIDAWPCAEIAATVGVAVPHGAYCAAVGDIDADGDLDLILQASNTPLRLFVNHEGERRAWARFDVVGIGSNTSAIGARVDLRTAGTWQTREVLSGTGFKSQDDFALHFGLDAATVIDELIVTWPSGARRRVVGYPAGATWQLLPPSALGDADDDGTIDVGDFYDFIACVGLTFGPGCERMDFDGDADVDRDDFAAFLREYDGPREDCNGNGILDLKDIFVGASSDQNQDGVPDECRR